VRSTGQFRQHLTIGKQRIRKNNRYNVWLAGVWPYSGFFTNVRISFNSERTKNKVKIKFLG